MVDPNAALALTDAIERNGGEDPFDLEEHLMQTKCAVDVIRSLVAERLAAPSVADAVRRVVDGSHCPGCEPSGCKGISLDSNEVAEIAGAGPMPGKAGSCASCGRRIHTCLVVDFCSPECRETFLAAAAHNRAGHSSGETDDESPLDVKAIAALMLDEDTFRLSLQRIAQGCENPISEAVGALAASEKREALRNSSEFTRKEGS